MQDYTNELISIIVLCTLILTRAIVATLFKWFHDNERHHIRYSNEYSTAELNLTPKPKPNLPKVPPNSPISEFDVFEKKPKAPPRDELV